MAFHHAYLPPHLAARFAHESADLPSLRSAVAHQVEDLINFLDSLDADNDEEREEDLSDFEETGDDEPSLGAPEPGIFCSMRRAPLPGMPTRAFGDQTSWAEGGAGNYDLHDVEADTCDDEDTHDLEATNEDGGDIQDEPHDAGEDDEDGHDAEAVNEDGTDLCDRPLPPLSHKPDPVLAASRPKVTRLDPNTFEGEYAMRVSGKCLEPVYADGSLLMFSPTEKYKSGDYVVIFRKPEFIPPGGFQGIVKRLILAVQPPKPGADPRRVSNIAPCLVVEMHNPPKNFTIPWEEVAAVHKCLGPVPANVRTYIESDDEVMGRARRSATQAA